MKLVRSVFFCFAIIALFEAAAFSRQQPDGTVRGTVTAGSKNIPLHAVPVLLVQLDRTVETNEDGAFEFQFVPQGQYNVVADYSGIKSEFVNVTVRSGVVSNITIQFKMSTGVPAAQPLQNVKTLDSTALTNKAATGLGEIVSEQSGFAERSFGPGAGRPLIRGFDGDRVVVLQDGISTGTLASQAGDHAEPIDVLGIERLDLIQGSATLLYGSNIVGGVVNAVSGHHQMKEESQPGLHTFMTGIAGSASRLGAGAIGFEYRLKNWLAWGNSSNQKTGDYKTARATVENSSSRLTDGNIGVGWYGKERYGAASYEYDDGVYGIPLGNSPPDEITGETFKLAPVRLDFFRRNIHLSGAARQLVPFFDGVRASLNYSSWNHREVDFPREGPIIANTFQNRQYTFQAFLDQKRRERWTGTVGVYGARRRFSAGGTNEISPPIKKDAVAAFGLEELSIGRLRFQFGGRVEHTRYRPRQTAIEVPAEPANPDNPDEAAPEVPPTVVLRPDIRKFTVGSGDMGVRFPTWRNVTVVANYRHSYRVPALEELYYNGPHKGNLTFEIGSNGLKSERNDGAELFVRHQAGKVRANGSVYWYQLHNFTFLAPTGNQNLGLTEAAYRQDDARYVGGEGSFGYQLPPFPHVPHIPWVPSWPSFLRSTIWLNGGVDYVRAELRATNTPLPRIPPLRGRLGVQGAFRGVLVRPEVVVAQAQNRVFNSETPTPGYTVFNMNAFYGIARQHSSHQFGVSVLNVGNRFYMNHSSFIKEIAPEPGRGVRVSYSVRFF